MIHNNLFIPLEEHEPMEEYDDDFSDEMNPDDVRLNIKKKNFLYMAS